MTRLNLPLLMIGEHPALTMYARVDWVTRLIYWMRDMGNG